MHNPLIVALDTPDKKSAMRLVEQLSPVVGYFKVGSELFTAEGPSIVREILKTGAKVFLDLKYHDIPATVSRAVACAVKLGVSMLTVHTSGGLQMMVSAEFAAQSTAAELKQQPPLVLGVTVLTSMDKEDLAEVGVEVSPEKQVLRLAELAIESGLRGLVCSPKELKKLRKKIPEDIQVVTPGIRSPDDPKDDQKRTMTPAEAIQAGANYIVVGRPITSAPDPRVAAEKVLKATGFC